jgi:drug/metabolite transporter (DMT)-like permease
MRKQFSGDTLFLMGMVLSMTCWGFSWTSGKILAMYGDPLTISFLRFFATVVSLLVLLLLMKKPLTIQRTGIQSLAFASVILSIYTFLFFKGLTVGKAGAGGVLVTVLNPIIAYALMLVLTRRTPTRYETIGLVLGLAAGIVLLKLTTEAALVFSAGNLYFLLAALSWALLSLFTAKAARYGSPVIFRLWMYGRSAVLLWLFSGLRPAVVTLEKGDLVFWSNLFFSSAITTALATTFFFVATARLGASKASSFIFLVPFSAALGSWLFLGEAIQAHTIAGGLLGIGAVYILNKKRRDVPEGHGK